MKTLAALLPFAIACSADVAPGELSVAVYGEDFIEVGIPSDEMVDGWSVTFDRFEVDIGDVGAGELTIAEYRLVDLAADTGGIGTVLAAQEVEGGVYDNVSYRIRSVEAAGTATKGTVQKSFSWIFPIATTYADCEGTAVVDGEPARLELTIHGDHLFYDDLVSSEPNVAFDLIAAADDRGDADGNVTQSELAAVELSAESRYQVGNYDIDDLWSFIDQQVSTLGHIDGEGHCGQAIREIR